MNSKTATSTIALRGGIADPVVEPQSAEPAVPAETQSPERPQDEKPLESAPFYGVGHNRGPPLLASDDVLDGGEAIHDFVCRLLNRRQSLAATYYQIARKRIPAHRFGNRLIGSRRGIAQALAVGTGLGG